MPAPHHLPTACDEDVRRALLRAHPTLDGIDYIEVVTEPDADNQRVLEVHFIPKRDAAAQQNLEALLDFLDGNTGAVRIEGGVRIRDIEVLAVDRVEDHLEVRVSRYGDFSDYTLHLEDVVDPIDPPRFEIDPVYGRCTFNFKAGCPSRFDCRPDPYCPPEPYPEPLIDYMAKDYASFRQALVDLIPTRIRGWDDDRAADLLIVLAELMAYTGDHLSYYQDAVSNEAYLETARQRLSVRRHARLIDYRMHDGCSARTFVHFRLVPGGAGFLQAGTRILTRIEIPLREQLPPHGPFLDVPLETEALDAAGAVFETMTAALLDDRLNEIPIYTWGNRDCCLPRGATTVELLGDLAFDPLRDGPAGDRREAWRLKRGDYLLFEEILSPDTGLAADADPAHRQVVRLTAVENTADPLLGETLTRVTWGRADALAFPLCVSTRLGDGTDAVVSVARGNLVLADHGRTLVEWHPGDPNEDPTQPGLALGCRAYRFRLSEGPLSFRLAPVDGDDGTLAPARNLLATDPHHATAQVCLDVERFQIETLSGWDPVPDLLDSSAFDQAFAVETDDDGRATLRFGDDVFGMAPPDGAFVRATYRIGIGLEGNVGADTLVHMLTPPVDPPCGAMQVAPPAPEFPTGEAFLPLNPLDVEAVRNPLAAWGGTAPEPVERVKRLAPAAFRAEQFRAVTEEDYARAAEKHPEVSRAVATFRWTGSWYTVFLSIDPVGRTGVSDALARSVRTWVTRYTLAGYDLEIQRPIYVPLDLEIDVCVCRDYFVGDVEEELTNVLSNRDLPDGRQGFFHPDRFTFAQPLYLSALYAAIEAVEGVDSALVRRFIRQTEPDPDPGRPATRRNLNRGYISSGRLEVLRLDNDPSFPENGVLRLNMLGGR